VNGINVLDVPVKPVPARYIKVIGVNKGIIPAGEYGAGGNALLLIDELIVE
jgi:hexosaminidase